MKQGRQKRSEKFKHNEERKRRKAEIIEDLTEFYSAYGTDTVSKQSLAEKYGISTKTLWEYNKDIFSKITEENLNRTYIDLMGGARVAYREARRILRDPKMK